MRTLDRDTLAKRHLTVLQMLPTLEAGGVERGTVEVSQALVEAGHRSLVMSAGGQMVDKLVAHGAQHLPWRIDKKRPWTLGLVGPLRRLLAAERVDILHLRSRMPAWVGWHAWRKMPPTTRPRLVTTVHGFYSVGRYSSVMTRGEGVIAVSNSIRDYITQNYAGVRPESITVIPRGVDESLYHPGFAPHPSWRAPWPTDGTPTTKVITIVGRLTRLKGHEDFIRLIEALQQRGISVRGVVVGGEHPGRKNYAQAIRSRAASLPITFTGHRTDSREIISKSDLVVSLSTQPESFGRTVLEALALGTPVVGYDHGGVGEILSTLFPRGAVPLGNQHALVKTVADALTNPADLPKENPYPLKKMLDSTLRLYQQLVTTPP